MNELNYASLEASKRLVEAGIVLETDAVWFFSTTGWELVQRYAQHPVNKHYVPAPSIAEVWRELPPTIGNENCLVLDKVLRTVDGVQVTSASYEYSTEDGRFTYKFYANTNPTDALIDLLIFIKSSGGAGRN